MVEVSYAYMQIYTCFTNSESCHFLPVFLTKKKNAIIKYNSKFCSGATGMFGKSRKSQKLFVKPTQLSLPLNVNRLAIFKIICIQNFDNVSFQNSVLSLWYRTIKDISKDSLRRLHRNLRQHRRHHKNNLRASKYLLLQAAQERCF